jgi:archaellum biogenesis ATPase FlaH
MREKHVLASAIKSRKAYDSIADHVEHSDLSEQGWVVWGGIGEYYSNDPSATSIDAELLAEGVARGVSAEKHKEMFRNLVRTISEFAVSPENVVTDLLTTKREVVGQKLANALLTGGDTRGLLDNYESLLVTTELAEDAQTETRQGYSIATLVDKGFDPESLVQVWPLSLNTRLDGGVKPGHHIVLFGRPEMGKTMAVIEMMAGFLHQGLTVLYIGNEDPIDDINMRVVNRLSLMSKFEVLNAPEEAQLRADNSGYQTLIMASLAPGTPREITALIEEHAPDVLVLDQLRNLNMHNDNYVLQLEQAATQARTWAKRYSCVVVSVTQAGDSASGKAVLDIGDVDYSNTGIPAQADLMIGIGANTKNEARGELVFSLPKNKISGRHEYFAVLTEPTLSQLIPLN